MQFDNKAIIVTGGATGIGKATSLEFANRGANVLIADIDENNGQDTAKTITNQGGKAIFQKVDVRKEEDVADMVNAGIQRFGKIDFAFNNAGIGPKLDNKPPHEMDIEQWQKIIDINLTGVFLCMKHEVNQLVKQNTGGVIINTSSIAGKRGGFSAYSTSKHGVMGLTKSYARSYAKDNIRICAINPAFINTPLLTKIGVDLENPEQLERLNNYQPMGRMGTVEEVAKVVAFLCSDDASFMTGTGVEIDGGFLA